jgi:hypothetical protein
VVGDPGIGEFPLYFHEASNIRDADEDNIGDALDASVGECKMENSVARLDNLMRDGDILTDEKVDMRGWNLCHEGRLPDVDGDVKGYL